jgi:hypothetical protein
VRSWRHLSGTLAVALILIATPGLAQDQEAPITEPAAPAVRSLEDFDPFPEAPDPRKASPATTAAYQEALQAYFAYRKAGYEHRLGVFAWQSLSTKIIFFVVLLLVLAGIGFAAIQFHAGLHGRGNGSAPAEETEISLSLSELKVRSPVLGVIILTISLAFFYLYLVHVYPIRNVF